MSAQWWEQLARARSLGRSPARCSIPTTLLYYWPYGRHGINFHPPLAGQLNLAAHAVFGRWMKDIPARRMASVIEFALTIAIVFGFLARRYGAWVGLVAAGSLLLMPRVYGQAHLVDTDIPGLFLWAATAAGVLEGAERAERAALAGARRRAAGPGVRREDGGGRRPGAAPALAGRRPPAADVHAGRVAGPTGSTAWSRRGDARCRWALAFLEIQRLQRQLPPPGADEPVRRIDPRATCPARSCAVPLAVWLVRRLLGRVFPASPVWGVERPALETWTAILAFAPVVGWLGNPAWWRETLPRLAHYYTLNTNRRGCAARHPDHLLRADLRVQPPLAQRAGSCSRSRSRPPSSLAAAIGLVWASATGPPRPDPALLPAPLPHAARAADAARPRRTTACACSCPRSSSSPPSRAGGRWPPADSSAGSSASRPRWRPRPRPRWCWCPAAVDLVHDPPVRALVLQRADRRPARGAGTGGSS